jgi:hypothetical protein
MRIGHRAERRALKDGQFVRSSRHALPYTYRPAPFLIFRIPHSNFRILETLYHFLMKLEPLPSTIEHRTSGIEYRVPRQLKFRR